MDARHDAIILGGGPAGISAALWLAKFRLDFLLIDRNPRLGGELPRIRLPIRDYPGLETKNGAEFREQLEKQIRRHFVPMALGTTVEHIDPVKKRVRLVDDVLEAECLILAMGLQRRRLGLPGESDLLERGLSYSATRDFRMFRDRPVAVVGGGDGALENALFLAEICPRVVLIHRGESFRARESFLRALAAESKIETRLSSGVRELLSDEHGLTGIVVKAANGEEESIPVSGLVVKIGFQPNVETLASGSLKTDEEGYLLTDRFLRTNVPGVFAAGDIANPRSPSIASAVGDGMVAAREVLNFIRNCGKASR